MDQYGSVSVVLAEYGGGGQRCDALGPPKVLSRERSVSACETLRGPQEPGSSRAWQNRPRLIQELIHGEYSGGLSSHAGRTESRESGESQTVRKAIPDVRGDRGIL